MGLRRLPLLLGPLALAGGLGAAAGAQTAGAPDFGERVEVAELLIEAIVTRPNGTPVEDLRAADFEVRQDGRILPVHAAVYYRFTAPADSPEHRRDDAGAPENRKFLLLLEAETGGAGLLEAPLAATRRAAATWVERELLAEDYVAIATRTPELELQVDFTRDRAAAAGWLAAGGGAAPTPAPDPAAPTLGPHLPPPGDGSLADTLRRLAHAGSHSFGRKNLILLSDVRAQAPAGDLDAAALALNTSNTAVYVYGLGRGERSLRLERLADITRGDFYPYSMLPMAPLRRLEGELRGYYQLSVTPVTRLEAAADYIHITVALRDPRLRVRALPSQRPLD